MTTRNDKEQKAYQEGRESAVEAIDGLSLEDLNILLHHIEGQRDSVEFQIRRLTPKPRRKKRMTYRAQCLTERQHQLHVEYRRKSSAKEPLTQEHHEAAWTYDLMKDQESLLEPSWCDYETFIMHLQFLRAVKRRNTGLPTKDQIDAHLRFQKLEQEHQAPSPDGELDSVKVNPEPTKPEAPSDDFTARIVQEFGTPNAIYMRDAQNAWVNHVTPTIKGDDP